MMIAEVSRSTTTVQIPPWEPLEDLTSPIYSPFSNTSTNSDYLTSLHNYLASIESEESELAPIDGFSCDYFRMYEFKVRRCARGRSHDWTECPYAHPGEKARRRDPRKYHYSGTACPDFRKGNCLKGDTCEFAHGVFECWLHPARYRTQPCKDGPTCRRRVCFFAHTPDQLRVLPQQSPRGTDSEFGSPVRHRLEAYLGSSPTSILVSPPVSPRSNSPPMSPSGCGSLNSVGELVASMRGLQIGKLKMGPWGQPRGSTLRPGFCSLPSTPATRSGLSQLEEPAMERVESGRDLRARIYAKLSKENSLIRVDSAGSGPDFGWVSELVK